MEAELLARRDLERTLREALCKERFDLHFQPVYGTDTREITGFEALLCLNGEGGEPISPATFLPIAEDMGLIAKLGELVLSRACRAAADMPELLTVAVKLSSAQLRTGAIVDVVGRALEVSGIRPARLELEITEGSLLNDTPAVLDQLAALKALGVGIVMDDFGTDHSQLGYLWRFPFDNIKIGGSFMQAFSANDANAAAVLRWIVSLGQSLRLSVTAEGVETEAQVSFLSSIACDHLQGSLFGQPLPLRDVAPLLLVEHRKRQTAAPDPVKQVKPSHTGISPARRDLVRNMALARAATPCNGEIIATSAG